LVLSEISDDYENIDQVILPEVSKVCAKCGLVIERSEIVDALARLIQDGLAKAYELSCWEPFSTELHGMPVVDLVEEDFKTYFYITKQGKDFHLSDDTWWPFDDQEELRPNWHLASPQS